MPLGQLKATRDDSVILKSIKTRQLRNILNLSLIHFPYKSRDVVIKNITINLDNKISVIIYFCVPSPVFQNNLNSTNQREILQESY